MTLSYGTARACATVRDDVKLNVNDDLRAPIQDHLELWASHEMNVSARTLQCSAAHHAHLQLLNDTFTTKQNYLIRPSGPTRWKDLRVCKNDKQF